MRPRRMQASTQASLRGYCQNFRHALFHRCSNRSPPRSSRSFATALRSDSKAPCSGRAIRGRGRHLREAPSISSPPSQLFRIARGRRTPPFWKSQNRHGRHAQAFWNLQKTHGDHAQRFWKSQDRHGDHAQAFWNLQKTHGDHAQAFWNLQKTHGDHTQGFWNLQKTHGDHARMLWTRGLAHSGPKIGLRDESSPTGWVVAPGNEFSGYRMRPPDFSSLCLHARLGL